MFEQDEIELIEWALERVKNSGELNDETQERIYQILDKIKKGV